MAKRIKWAAGQLIKVAAIIGGLYLVIIVFGWEPLCAIKKIWQTENGWRLLEKTFWQLLKMLFGMGYSFIGMAILCKIGHSITEKNKNW